MMRSIPFTAPVAPTPHGLLASTYWWTWLAYLIVLPMAYALMPGQLRESVKALWAPVGAFFAAFHAPLAVGLWGWVVLGVLRPFRGLLGAVKDLTLVVEQLLRLGYIGYRRPVLT